jgi:hypothetical protein
VDGDVFIATLSQIIQLHTDPITGKTTQTTLPPPGGQSQQVGLQVLPTQVNLGGTVVPTGSLLVDNGDSGVHRVYAIIPTSGTLLASLDLGSITDAVAGAIAPDSTDLMILRDSANEVDHLDSTTGAVQSHFSTQLATGSVEGGLTIDPITSNLLIGATNSSVVRVVTPQGTPVQTIDLSPYGITNDITGLVFDQDGKLLVSSLIGTVLRITIPGLPLRIIAPARASAN